MSSFNKKLPIQINRLQAICRGVEANVEATLIHFDFLLERIPNASINIGKCRKDQVAK